MTRYRREITAPAPLILSVSRRSDIPASFLESFFSQLRRGYTYVRNPFTHQEQLVDLTKVRYIAFSPSSIMPMSSESVVLSFTSILLSITMKKKTSS